MAYWYHELEFRPGSPSDVITWAVESLQKNGDFVEFGARGESGLAYYANGDLYYESSNAIADILRSASSRGADSELFMNTNSDGEATDLTFYERGRMNTIVELPYFFLEKDEALATLDATVNSKSAAILSRGFASAEREVNQCYDCGANLAAIAEFLSQTDFVPSAEEAEQWKQVCLELEDSDFSDTETIENLLGRAEAVLTGAVTAAGSGKIRSTGL